MSFISLHILCVFCPDPAFLLCSALFAQLVADALTSKSLVSL